MVGRSLRDHEYGGMGRGRTRPDRLRLAGNAWPWRNGGREYERSNLVWRFDLCLGRLDPYCLCNPGCEKCRQTLASDLGQHSERANLKRINRKAKSCPLQFDRINVLFNEITLYDTDERNRSLNRDFAAGAVWLIDS